MYLLTVHSREDSPCGNPPCYTCDCCVIVSRVVSQWSPRSYKRRARALTRSTNSLKTWLSVGVLNWEALALLIFVDCFEQKMLEEYLRVAREVLLPSPATPLPSSDPFWESFPCIYQWGNHSRIHSVDGLHLVVSYSWDFEDGSTQELTSLVSRLNLSQRIQEEGKFPFQDARRGLARH